jgi:hypothetical protein
MHASKPMDKGLDQKISRVQTDAPEHMLTIFVASIFGDDFQSQQ